MLGTGRRGVGGGASDAPSACGSLGGCEWGPGGGSPGRRARSSSHSARARRRGHVVVLCGQVLMRAERVELVVVCRARRGVRGVCGLREGVQRRGGRTKLEKTCVFRDLVTCIGLCPGSRL